MTALPCIRRWWPDVLVVVLLCGLAASASWLGSGLAVEAHVFPGRDGGGQNDVWFDADTRDALRRLTADTVEITGERHPFEGLAMRWPVRFFTRIAPHADAAAILRVLLSVAAASWSALLFVCFRVARCHRLDAVLFATLSMTSAASVFWFVVPDYFVFGAVTTLPAMLLAALAGRRSIPQWASIGVVILSTSVTVTNAMFGTAASLVAHRRGRALQVMVTAFLLMVLLWQVQSWRYPDLVSPLVDGSYDHYLFLPDNQSPSGPIAAFLFHGMVMPQVGAADVQAVHTTNDPEVPGESVLTVQSAWPGSGGLLGLIAVVAWAGILMAGAISLWQASVAPALRHYLLMVVAGQLCLHLAFGVETFLYAPHFLPPLLMIGAAGTLGSFRPVVRGLGVTLLICVTINNGTQLQRSFEMAPPLTAAMASENPD